MNKNECRFFDALQVMSEDFFDTNSEVLDRITKTRNFDKESKRVEYEQKKAELERMKKNTDLNN